VNIYMIFVDVSREEKGKRHILQLSFERHGCKCIRSSSMCHCAVTRSISSSGSLVSLDFY